MSGRGAHDTTKEKSQLYVNNTIWKLRDLIGQEKDLKRNQLSWQAVLVTRVNRSQPQQQSAEFIKLAGTIREPQPSIFQRVIGIVTRVAFVTLLVDLIRTIYKDKSRISRPPGSLLGSIAEFVFSKKTVERVVTPILSDLQVEYCEALAEDRKIKAGWVRLRGYWSLFKALGLYSIVRMFVDMWRKISSV
jgi:hypothetical protein